MNNNLETRLTGIAFVFGLLLLVLIETLQVRQGGLRGGVSLQEQRELQVHQKEVYITTYSLHYVSRLFTIIHSHHVRLLILDAGLNSTYSPLMLGVRPLSELLCEVKNILGVTEVTFFLLCFLSSLSFMFSFSLSFPSLSF